MERVRRFATRLVSCLLGLLNEGRWWLHSYYQCAIFFKFPHYKTGRFRGRACTPHYTILFDKGVWIAWICSACRVIKHQLIFFRMPDNDQFLCMFSWNAGSQPLRCTPIQNYIFIFAARRVLGPFLTSYNSPDSTSWSDVTFAFVWCLNVLLSMSFRFCPSLNYRIISIYIGITKNDVGRL